MHSELLLVLEMNTESDVFLVELPRARATSFSEKCEDIVIKPSPEHIPDEYEHDDNTKGMVFIFYNGFSEDFPKIEKLAKTLEALGYKIPDEQAILCKSKETVNVSLAEIASETRTDITCLIIFFFGIIEANDTFVFDDESSMVTKDVWQHFTADKCPDLRNVPKIFIFEGAKKVCRVQADTTSFQVIPDIAYDVPAEADILIIFKRNDDSDHEDFIIKLCENVNKYGKRDDIMSLMTYIDMHETRPLLISTLTKRFYLAASDHKRRGYYLDLGDQILGMNSLVDELKKKIIEIETQKKKKSVTKSFRRDVKPLIEKRLPNKINPLSNPEPIVQTVQARSNVESDFFRPSVAKPIENKTPHPKKKPTSKSKEPRNRSTSISSKKSDQPKKPAWKY